MSTAAPKVLKDDDVVALEYRAAHLALKAGPGFPMDLIPLREAAAKNDVFWTARADEWPEAKATEIKPVQVLEHLAGALYTPPTKTGKRGIFYIHSGGLFCVEEKTEAFICKAIASVMQATVLSLEFRRLPDEASLQGLIDDLVAGYLYMSGALGFNPKDIIVIGGSGGGAGTLYLLLELKKRGLALPLAGCPLFPAGGALEHAENAIPDVYWPSVVANVDRFVSSELLLWIANLLNQPNIVETARDLLQVKRFVGLPPLLITGSSNEASFTNQQHLALLAAQAGVNVTWKAWPGAFHAAEFLHFMPWPLPHGPWQFFIKWMKDHYEGVEHV